MAKLSVVIPTLNCMQMLPGHLASMRPWLSLAEEIVVVDSFSDDGTPEFIKKNLRHRNLRVLSHPRGLYQSWNYGISQTNGDWIYISTVGDSMSRDLLAHLLKQGGESGCDVIASRPNFVAFDGKPLPQPMWPIHHVIRAYAPSEFVVLNGPESFLYGVHNAPNAVLGSSASNLYRGEHLRARPFPTGFGTTGDTAWTLQYGLQTRFGFTAMRGSTFRMHPKAYSAKEYEVRNLQLKYYELAALTLARADYSAEIEQGIVRHKLRATVQSLLTPLQLAAAAGTPATAAPTPVTSTPSTVPAGSAGVVRPRSLNLQAIDVCNSRCIMCHIWKEGRKEVLSLAELRVFLRQPFFADVGHVGVTGGEPTLRKDLVELYTVLADCLPKLTGASFITHGMQSAKAVDFYLRVHELYRARGLRFDGMVSLDGVDEVHDRVRGRAGAFAAAAQTLLELKQRGVAVIAACTITRSNVYGLHDLLAWGRANGVYVRFRVAEFIRRLYNDPCAPEIRSFTTPEIRHLVSFFHVLLTEYEQDAVIKKTYTSILSLLTGGERLVGCPYRSGQAVNIGSQGELASCAPKGESFAMPASEVETHARLAADRGVVATRQCAKCIHDYHDDWDEAARGAQERDQARTRELYGVADEELTTPEAAAEPLRLEHMERILLAGWYGTETAGDIAILQGIVTEYLDRNPQLRFVVLSLYPYYTRTTIAAWPEDLQARITVADYASEAAWQATGECDAVVMAGGPLMDIGETRQILCLFKRFADLGKPRVIEGCGIGPLNQAAYRWNVSRIARLATRVAVRDRASRELLRSYGIRKEIEVRADPAQTWLRAQGLRHHGGDGKVIRCFLRELTAEYPQAVTPAQVTEALAGLLRRLLEWYPEHRIELWAMHHFPVGYDDRLFARELVKRVGDPRVTADWTPRTPREIMAAMAAADFCVCMRFHSCVFASEVGAPFLAIDYTDGGKIRAFLEDNGREQRLCRLADVPTLEREGFATRLAAQPVPTVEPAGAGAEPLVLHVIQSLSGGGGARAMVALAKYSRRFGGPRHRLVSLLPADATGMALAAEAGVEVMDHPGSKTLDRALAAADIVLVHWWNVPELAALFERELPPMRLALWCHVSGHHSPQVLTPALVDFADLAVACSPHTHAHPVFDPPAAGAPRRGAMVLAGADFARLEGICPVRHEGFRVGYLGTVDRMKMHADYVAMSCAVNVPDVKFVVCGTGNFEWLVQGAAQAGRSGSFEFTGAVEDIRQAIGTFDVYGYPLCADTYAAAELNLQEVMFAGKAVVAFPHGGIGRLIEHGVTGLLVHTVEEYARALEHLYHHPEERARLGANAAAHARRHWGAENSARGFNAHFAALLAQPKRRREWPVAPGTLSYEETVFPAARRFLRSLGPAAAPFQASLAGACSADRLQAEEQIMALPRLVQATGVLAYRNAHPKDALLQFWAGLGFLGAGESLHALGAFTVAYQAGLTHWHVCWRIALVAERVRRPADAQTALQTVLKAAPDFMPAVAMRQRLGATGMTPVQLTSAEQARREVQQAERYLGAGRLPQARECLQRALGLVPQQIILMELLADLENRLGNADSARRLCAAIIAQDPTRATPRFKTLRAALRLNDGLSAPEMNSCVSVEAVEVTGR